MSLLEDETFRVLVITGYDDTEENFFNRIVPYLYDNFKIRGVYALGQPTETEHEGFIAFVAGNETDLWTVDAQTKRISRRSEDGLTLRVEVFEDMDEALDHARDEYGFDYSAEIKAFRVKAQEVYDKFGYSTADEVEKFRVVVALANAGMLALTRGILDDEKVPVLALVSEGADGVKVRPISILMNEYILENLEMPADIPDDND